jgi:hypothetical protein
MELNITQEEPRRVSVFFYGSFIDLSVLAEAEYHPKHLAVARLNGFDIVACPLANLISSVDQVVYGILTTASHEELDRLYGRDWVRAYLPEAVVVTTGDGAFHPALCYVAPGPTAERPFENYIGRITAAALRHGFPQPYIDRLEKLR